MNSKLMQAPNVTVRAINRGLSQVDDVMFDLICKVSSFTIQQLGIQEHLMVTVLAAEMVWADEDNKHLSEGFGYAQPGLFHVVMSGMKPSIETRDTWLAQMTEETIREIVHCYLETLPVLVGSEPALDEEFRLVEKTLEAYHANQSNL